MDKKKTRGETFRKLGEMLGETLVPQGFSYILILTPTDKSQFERAILQSNMQIDEIMENMDILREAYKRDEIDN